MAMGCWHPYFARYASRRPHQARLHVPAAEKLALRSTNYDDVFPTGGGFSPVKTCQRRREYTYDASATAGARAGFSTIDVVDAEARTDGKAAS